MERLMPWPLVALVFVPFVALMLRWNAKMRANRRVILLLLETRGWSSLDDLATCAGGRLHAPTLRVTIRWLVQDTHEVQASLPPGSQVLLYRLTVNGAGSAQRLRNKHGRRFARWLSGRSS